MDIRVTDTKGIFENQDYSQAQENITLTYKSYDVNGTASVDGSIAVTAEEFDENSQLAAQEQLVKDKLIAIMDEIGIRVISTEYVYDQGYYNPPNGVKLRITSTDSQNRANVNGFIPATIEEYNANAQIDAQKTFAANKLKEMLGFVPEA